MKVTARNWQAHAALSSSQTSQTPKADAHTDSVQDPREAMDTDILETSMAPASRSGSDADSSFKVKSSGPSNSVGELAAMLARSETLMDVQQVFSKAMRALADLKMGAIASEGKDAKKYAQQIKRMEKLIKRIQKKLKHLAKEQRMEDQAEKAAKKAELEKEKQIRQELEARRKKRRREEKEYALKELSQDGKDSVNETVSSMLSAASPSPDVSALTGMDGAMVSGDLGGIDLGGLDLMA